MSQSKLIVSEEWKKKYILLMEQYNDKPWEWNWYRFSIIKI